MTAEAEPPETLYTNSDDGVCIAYQAVGRGRFDLVVIPDWRHHIEAQWDDPALAAWPPSPS